MFNITDHKGFQMTFSNGITISVQWGPGNYTDNDIRNMAFSDFQAPRKSNMWKADLAEIAIWKDRSGTWITRHFMPDLGDDVAGYLDADKVGALIGEIVALSADQVDQIKVKSFAELYSDD